MIYEQRLRIYEKGKKGGNGIQLQALYYLQT